MGNEVNTLLTPLLPFQTFLSNIYENKVSAWLGLSYVKEEGMWQWVDRSPLDDR